MLDTIESLNQEGVDKAAPWSIREEGCDTLGRGASLENQTQPEQGFDIWDAVRRVGNNDGWARMEEVRYHVIEHIESRHCHPAKVLQETSRRMDELDVLCVDTGD